MKSSTLYWLLGVGCVVVFFPGLRAGLTHYDDSLYIYHNTAALSRPGLSGFLYMWDSARSWRGEFVEFFPLRDSVYWLLYQRFGIEGTPYHLVSLAFHLLAVVLAHRLVLSMGFSRLAAGITATLFAFHPIHVESVLWVAALKDPMYTSFQFASLLFFQRYRRSLKPLDYAGCLAFLIAALLVKSMAIVVPALMVIFGRFLTPKLSFKQLAQYVTGPALIVGLYFVQFVLIGRANGAVRGPHGGSWANHAVLTLWSQVMYLRQVIVPSRFRLIYCFEPPSGLTDWRFLVGLAVAAAVIGVFVWWRQSPLRSLTLWWYFICLLPVSNLIPFPALMADRYLYAASFGICLLAAQVLEKVRWALGLTVAFALVLGLTTFTRSMVWQHEDSLWEEPDLDPECMTDKSFPAAQSHLLRHWTAADHETVLLSLERAISSAAMTDLSREHYCDILNDAAQEAVAFGAPERGDSWARQAVHDCGYAPATWAAVMAVNMHRRPLIAAGAAEKLNRLARTPQTQMLRALTRIEMGDREVIAELPALVRSSPGQTCPALSKWADEVPKLAPRVAEALSLCPPAPAPTPAPSRPADGGFSSSPEQLPNK